MRSHRKPIMIPIPNPCHESWEEMTPSGQGRFCNSCQKTVIDFTGWTDKDLQNFFKNGSNVCGRFRESQIERKLENSVVSQPAFFRIVASFGLMFLFAQVPLVSVARLKGNAELIVESAADGTNDAEGCNLRGVILDEWNRPVSGASIVLLNARPKKSCITKSDGSYQFIDIAPGLYDISISADEMDTLVDRLSIHAEHEMKQNYMLKESWLARYNAALKNNDNGVKTLTGEVEIAQSPIPKIPIKGPSFLDSLLKDMHQIIQKARKRK